MPGDALHEFTRADLAAFHSAATRADPALLELTWECVIDEQVRESGLGVGGLGFRVEQVRESGFGVGGLGFRVE